jgi:hypothetical protein
MESPEGESRAMAKIGVFFIVLLATPKFAFASPFIIDNFVRTGQTATLVAPFTTFGGVTAPGQWSGLIEVIVSGSGVNVPANYFHEDAFYPFDPATNVLAQGPGILPPNALHISFTGCSVSFECGALRISNFFTFVEGVGFVTVPPEIALPDSLSQITIQALLELIPYSPDHLYHFVIDIGSTPQFLTLGHGDGGVWDNSGEYDIQLFSVAPVAVASVPEPSSFLLLFLGLTGLGIFKCRKQWPNS